MYLQITTRCNMACPHCGFSCSPFTGVDMSMTHFEKALEYIMYFGQDMISVGGGEPTIHPNFYEIMGKLISFVDYVWISTNGKNKEAAKYLVKMTSKDVIHAVLSIDPYHEPIDEEVVNLFKNIKLKNASWRYSFVNNVHTIVRAGRAKDWPDAIDECICNDIFINPHGEIRSCGCENSKLLGHLDYGLYITEDEFWKYLASDDPHTGINEEGEYMNVI